MAAPVQRLPWNEFFRLRSRRQLVQRVAGIPGIFVGAAATFVGAGQFVDPAVPIAGMDPNVLVGAGAMAMGAVGYVAGGALSGALWRVSMGDKRQILDDMERDYLNRVARLRADPALQLLNKPVPDYYGEKVHSIADFRRWLRLQRDFTRNAQFFRAQQEQEAAAARQTTANTK